MRDAAMTVECPECGAKPGERCIDSRTGKPAGMLVHKARVDLWKELGR